MLALSRNKGESIVCRTKSGEEIRIVVAKAGSGWVQLGFDAPQSVKILRAELDTQGKGKQ